MRFLLSSILLTLVLLLVFLRMQDRRGLSAQTTTIQASIVLRREWVRCSLDLIDRNVTALACENDFSRELLDLYSQPQMLEALKVRIPSLEIPDHLAVPRASTEQLLLARIYNRTTVDRLVDEILKGGTKSDTSLALKIALLKASIQAAPDASLVPTSREYRESGAVSWYYLSKIRNESDDLVSVDSKYSGDEITVYLQEEFKVSYYKQCVAINAELISRRAASLKENLASRANSETPIKPTGAPEAGATALAVDSAFARDLELLGYIPERTILWLIQPHPDKIWLLNMQRHVAETRECLEKAESRWRQSLR